MVLTMCYSAACELMGIDISSCQAIALHKEMDILLRSSTHVRNEADTLISQLAELEWLWPL